MVCGVVCACGLAPMAPKKNNLLEPLKILIGDSSFSLLEEVVVPRSLLGFGAIPGLLVALGTHAANTVFDRDRDDGIIITGRIIIPSFRKSVEEEGMDGRRVRRARPITCCRVRCTMRCMCKGVGE